MKNLIIFTTATLACVTFLTSWASGKSIGPDIRNIVSKHNNSTDQGPNEKIVVDVGNDVELNCGVQKRVSSDHYVWFKQNPSGIDKKQLTQFRGRFELSSRGQVKIRSLTYEDSGLYICKLASSEESYSIRLSVGNETFKNNLLKPPGGRRGNSVDPYSEPEIYRDILPKDKVYSYPETSVSFTLKCTSKGNPEPTITWYRNGQILSSSRGNVSMIKLPGLTKRDEGTYKCESVNIFGISVYEVVLKINEPSQGAAEILELSPKNLTIPLGSSVNISCTGKFETHPYFFWIKRALPNELEHRVNRPGSRNTFFHNDTSAYYEVLQSSPVKKIDDGIYSTELILTNVTKNNTGVYYCAVAGPQGYNVSDTTIIVENVSSHPQFSNTNAAAAQWAILWTLSFVILVMLIVLCFVRIYGCHNHQIKTECKVVDRPRKAQLPERSPQTMSTHCPTYPTGQYSQEACLPLMVGSSSLSSQDQCMDSVASDPCQYYQAHPNSLRSFSDVSSRSSTYFSNSTLLADLEAARSSCSNRACPKYPLDPRARKECCSTSRTRRHRHHRAHRSDRPYSTHIHTHHHPNGISRSSPRSCSYEYISNNNTNTNSSSSNLRNGECNLSSTDCESSFYEPQRNKVSHHRHEYEYFYANNSQQL